jgi:hypothetical protein
MNTQLTKKKKPESYLPESYFKKSHRFEGHQRCIAWNPNKGKQCGKLAMKKMNVCRSHGGATPKGINSPNFVSGKYSKYLPKKFTEENLQDSKIANFRSLDDEIELSKMLTSGILENIFANHLESKSLDESIAIDIKMLEQINRNIDSTRKLTLAERQLLIDQEEYISREWAKHIFGEILKSIRSNVLQLQGGKEAIQRISNDIGRFSYED